jgi:hypothetical protein
MVVMDAMNLPGGRLLDMYIFKKQRLKNKYKKCSSWESFDLVLAHSYLTF